MTDIRYHKILILDFGSQYTQLIARRIRELGVYCEIHSYNIKESKFLSFKAKGIILSGSPKSVINTHSVPSFIFSLSVPILGICYGMQAMVSIFGGKVIGHEKGEFGLSKISSICEKEVLFNNIPKDHNVWMSHKDTVVDTGKLFNVIAKSENSAIAAVKHIDKPWYGLQYHPEVTHSVYGQELFKNFVFTLCSCDALWKAVNIVDSIINNIRNKVKNEKVILGVSGGVDSTVVASLLYRAIGNNLICIFVDNGLLRLNESEELLSFFKVNMDVPVITVNATDIFLSHLKGVTEPEEKRKIVGKLFIDVFDRESRKLNGVKWLAQGTIYPDVIESASDSSHTHVIKSHHNVGGLPSNMKFSLLEPLRDLFKDEVRKIGLTLSLPHSVVYRHPFPGPGLSIRIMGEVKEEYLHILRKVDAIFISQIKKANWYYKVSQAFAVFLPIKSVGVVGDQRKYDYVVALRVVKTVDFMTADWVYLPHELTSTISKMIVNEVPGVSRVVYDITGKPPGTIEWE